jgi:hypothetical protein
MAVSAKLYKSSSFNHCLIVRWNVLKRSSILGLDDIFGLMYRALLWDPDEDFLGMVRQFCPGVWGFGSGGLTHPTAP